MRFLYADLKQQWKFVGIVALALMAASSITVADDGYAPADLSGKRVAILAGEGLHDPETLAPIGFLVNRGAAVTVIGVAPGYAKAYNSDTWVRIEKSVDEVTVEAFDAIVIPGGSSPAYLREHENVVAFAREAVEAGKVAAAICHGPQLLISAGVLDGKKATAYSGVADELREAGAVYDDVPMMRDGTIITSRIPQDLPVFVRAIEEALTENN